MSIIKEDVPVNSVGPGNIASVGIKNDDKSPVWGEPPKSTKKKKLREIIFKRREIETNGTKV